MRINRSACLLVGAIWCGWVGHARADNDVASELEVLKAQINQLQKANARMGSELQSLRSEQQGDWLNQRRQEEVRALVQDVLSDADMRASLQDDGLTAGHNGKNFYLAAADGSFLMKISGQIQVRYILNSRDSKDPVDEFGDPILDDDGEVVRSSVDEWEGGFQIRRTKLNFSGHVGSPKIEYDLTLAADRSDNSVGVEDVTVGYKLMDNLKVEAGRKKLPFLREELTSSKRQLAVDRASVTEVFTLNRSEGVWVTWSPADKLKITTAISDGENAGNIGGANDFHEDRTDFAITARADLTLAGNPKQARDFAAWSGEPLGIFLGAAIHYELGETGDSDPSNNPDYFSWTVDASIETNGLNVFASFTGGHIEDVIGTDEFGESTTSDFDNYGLLVQGGYMVIPDKLEPFVRYEWIDFDDDREDSDKSLITIGANYYLRKHAAKFTLDWVYAFDNMSDVSQQAGFGANGRSSGLGLRKDDADRDGQWALRAQFQLLF